MDQKPDEKPIEYFSIQEVHEHLSRRSLRISADTIRKYLKLDLVSCQEVPRGKFTEHRFDEDNLLDLDVVVGLRLAGWSLWQIREWRNDPKPEPLKAWLRGTKTLTASFREALRRVRHHRKQASQ